MSQPNILKKRYDATLFDALSLRQDMSRYPSEDLIRYIMGRYKGTIHRNKIAILDLGCGEGANVRFLRREGFDVVGVDGSIIALKKNKDICELENIDCKLVNSDFTKLPFKKKIFDCIIDISSIQHNAISDISSIINQIYDLLKKGGELFSFCLQKGSYGYAKGEKIEENTFLNIKDTFCKSKACTHFFSRDELVRLHRKFNIVSIDEVARTFNDGKFCWKHWIFTVRR